MIYIKERSTQNLQREKRSLYRGCRSHKRDKPKTRLLTIEIEQMVTRGDYVSGVMGETGEGDYLDELLNNLWNS